jgi:hypothetical protein
MKGVLIGLHRCQAFRVAQKKHKGADGNSYAKGDVIAADCNVTGTDIGTPTKPKYALKNLWEHMTFSYLRSNVWWHLVGAVLERWWSTMRTTAAHIRKVNIMNVDYLIVIVWLS